MIWLISGVPGAGKSATAHALCRRYPRAIHIPVDDIRDFVVSGFASPLDPLTRETTRQFRLARQAAAQMAASYDDAGYAAVIDDVVDERYIDDFLPSFAGRPLHKVVLLPPLSVALARNRDRTNKLFDPALLEPVSVRLDRDLRSHCRPKDGWIVIDNGKLDPDATADAVHRIATAALRQ